MFAKHAKIFSNISLVPLARRQPFEGRRLDGRRKKCGTTRCLLDNSLKQPPSMEKELY